MIALLSVALMEVAMTFTLTSPSFADGAPMPAEHTADGADVSPELRWSGAPSGTKSFALIVDDPDAPDPAAPRMVWVHWVLYDIPSDAHALPKAAKAASLPPGTREGRNDWSQTGWRGPAPPVGRHRYVFKLYALDTVLPDLGGPSKARLEGAMKGHVLAETKITGTYQRGR